MLLHALLLASLCTPDDPFATHWRDGQAELSGYRYTVQRYGQERSGQCMMVFVTEPFSKRKLVKLDDPSRNPQDSVEVLKLNLIRDFQTGIYDYDTMVSVFSDTQRFDPLKITFSSAEWCGHVYEELRFEGRIRQRVDSYFEGETGAKQLDMPKGGVSEDELFIRLRGLRGAPLQPGEERELPFLPSVFRRRLAHEPLAWTSAKIVRANEPVEVEVPAGTFATIAYTLTVEDGRTGKFWIESAWPQRVVRWEWTASAKGTTSEGCDRGELTGSERIAYWNTHDNGDERRLKALGHTPSGLPGSDR